MGGNGTGPQSGAPLANFQRRFLLVNSGAGGETGSPQPPAIHFGRLDAVRGLAAQPVLLSHALAMLFPDDTTAATYLVRWAGHLSVLVFFVLSGFVIVQGIVREMERRRSFDWFDFGIRRVARIYPPYLVAVAMVAMLTTLASNGMLISGTGETMKSDPMSFDALMRAITFLFTSRDTITAMDGPIWSLRLEVVLYVITALIACAIVSRGLRRGMFAAATLLLVSVFCWRLSFALPSAILFSSGGVAAIYFGQIKRIPLALSAVALAAALSLPAIVPSLTGKTTLALIYQSLLGLPLAAFIASLAATSPQHTSTAEGFVTRSGDWSYSLYILHWPFLVVFYSTLQWRRLMPDNSLSRLALVVFAFIGINAIAYLIARAVERPSQFAALLRRWTGAKKPATT